MSYSGSDAGGSKQGHSEPDSADQGYFKPNRKDSRIILMIKKQTQGNLDESFAQFV